MDIINAKKLKSNIIIIVTLIFILFGVFHKYRDIQYNKDIEIAKYLYAELQLIKVGARGRLKIVQLNSLDSNLYNYIETGNKQFKLVSDYKNVRNLDQLKGIEQYLQIMSNQNFVAFNRIENDSCIQFIFWYSTDKQLVCFKEKGCIKNDPNIKFKKENWAISELPLWSSISEE